MSDAQKYSSLGLRTRATRTGRLATAAFAAAFLAFAAPVLPAGAAEGGGWIGTWSASPQPIWEPDFIAPIGFPRNLWNQTIREVARVSLGGSQVRVVLTNEYGSQPLVVSEAHVAISDGEAKIKDGTDRKLTFSGSSTIAIPSALSSSATARRSRGSPRRCRARGPRGPPQ